jgi:polysaccharide pyruvyl transferase WcaK-like protein
MMDIGLELWMAGLIETARLRWMLGHGDRWRPGRPLRLLFAGYNGTRNTGSDVRVQEMLRQIRHVLGPERVELTVMTQNFNLTRGYFEGARQIHLPDVFPPFLFREVPQYDGVVACEGSMFKSQFANALTTMMVGALGLATACNRLAVGYGAEAGRMEPHLQWLVKRYCHEALIITRNEESRQRLAALGIPTELGTDTAWTFEPSPPTYGRQQLSRAGWDGKAPVLALCPIHPFWWPVRASLGKFLLTKTTGAYRSSQYRSIYFHRSGPAVEQQFARYLNSLARAARAFCQRTGAFPICIAMEQLDTDACRRLAAELPHAPVFTSAGYDMFELVSILRTATWLVSSRYHAIVTSMPAGVVSAGVTMDERIRNLLHERGHADLLLGVDDPDLEARLEQVLERLRTDAEAIRQATLQCVARNLQLMARMGVYFEEHLQRLYPDFPVRQGIHCWEDYLPPLSPTLRALLEQYAV